MEDLTQRVTVRGPEAHHLRDVLRVKPGSSVEAFDGRGNIARGEVVGLDRESVKLELGEAEPSTAEPTLAVTLAVALLKGDKLTDVVGPATEIGVGRFVLFVSTNCEARELSAVRLTRLRRVAQEAARQSGRAVVPPITEPVSFDALELDGTVLVGDPAAEERFADYVSALGTNHVGAGAARRAARAGAVGRAGAAGRTDVGGLAIVTGPEGGLTDAEVERLQTLGAVGLRLGPRILRADTAPVAMAAAILLSAS